MILALGTYTKYIISRMHQHIMILYLMHTHTDSAYPMLRVVLDCSISKLLQSNGGGGRDKIAMCSRMYPSTFYIIMIFRVYHRLWILLFLKFHCINFCAWWSLPYTFVWIIHVVNFHASATNEKYFTTKFPDLQEMFALTHIHSGQRRYPLLAPMFSYWLSLKFHPFVDYIPMDSAL